MQDTDLIKNELAQSGLINSKPQYGYLQTPVGMLEICTLANAVASIYFCENPAFDDVETPLLAAAKAQLSEYIVGTRTAFDLPLQPKGTDFQQQVWQQLRQIPYGQTCSYSDIACALGDKNAVRAVGAANGKNPISIIVPCHRVIGKNGKLTGYAGGLSRKAWLLSLEKQDNRGQQEMF